MTRSESPFLTEATSCYSTNTMIDIICTGVATGRYMQNMPCGSKLNTFVLLISEKCLYSFITVKKINYVILYPHTLNTVPSYYEIWWLTFPKSLEILQNKYIYIYTEGQYELKILLNFLTKPLWLLCTIIIYQQVAWGHAGVRIFQIKVKMQRSYNVHFRWKITNAFTICPLNTLLDLKFYAFTTGSIIHV